MDSRQSSSQPRATDSLDAVTLKTLFIFWIECSVVLQSLRVLHEQRRFPEAMERSRRLREACAEYVLERTNNYEDKHHGAYVACPGSKVPFHAHTAHHVVWTRQCCTARPANPKSALDVVAFEMCIETCTVNPSVRRLDLTWTCVGRSNLQKTSCFDLPDHVRSGCEWDAPRSFLGL